MELTTLALLVFFIVTGLKDFGVVFKYADLIRGVSAFVVVFALLFGKGFGL